MASGLAVSIVPSIVSSGIFSSRRFNSGMDAMAANNVPVGIMNCDIAGGQITNAFQAAVDIAKESKNAVAAKIVSAEEMIRKASESNKLLKGTKATLEFTGRYINPIICGTGVVRTLVADDKVDEGCRQFLGITTMLTGENLIKRAVCIPITKRVNGKRVVEHRYAWYKNYPMIDKQVKAFNDACATKKFLGKSLKFVPGALKGTALVGTSITCYIIGDNVGKKVSPHIKALIEKHKANKKTKQIALNVEHTASNAHSQAA